VTAALERVRVSARSRSIAYVVAAVDDYEWWPGRWPAAALSAAFMRRTARS
jgi:hypothetical protein